MADVKYTTMITITAAQLQSLRRRYMLPHRYFIYSRHLRQLILRLPLAN